MENIIARLVSNAISGEGELLQDEIDVVTQPKDGIFDIVLKCGGTFKVIVENATR